MVRLGGVPMGTTLFLLGAAAAGGATIWLPGAKWVLGTILAATSNPDDMHVSGGAWKEVADSIRALLADAGGREAKVTPASWTGRDREAFTTAFGAHKDELSRSADAVESLGATMEIVAWSNTALATLSLVSGITVLKLAWMSRFTPPPYHLATQFAVNARAAQINAALAVRSKRVRMVAIAAGSVVGTANALLCGLLAGQGDVGHNRRWSLGTCAVEQGVRKDGIAVASPPAIRGLGDGIARDGGSHVDTAIKAMAQTHVGPPYFGVLGVLLLPIYPSCRDTATRFLEDTRAQLSHWQGGLHKNAQAWESAGKAATVRCEWVERKIR